MTRALPDPRARAFLLVLLVSGCGRYGFAHHETDLGTSDLGTLDAGMLRDANVSDLATMDSPQFDGQIPDAQLDGREPDDLGEMPRVRVEPTSGLTTSETGATATFTIVLTSVPTANVSITIASLREGEATVSPEFATFTPSNFAAPQTITVTGVDDALVDGNQDFTIDLSDAISADVRYDGMSVDDVMGQNIDDESPGIMVTPTSGLHTTEAGGNATFSVALQAQPESDVGIPITSSNTAEGTTSVSMATFTNSNWNVPQAITVTGVDDATRDGDVAYQITIGPAVGAAEYVGVSGTSVEVINDDNESANFSVTPSALSVSEAGTADTFTVVLTTTPGADVSFALSSDDTTEMSLSPAALTFTPGNWNVPQTVTVTGENDSIVDGDSVTHALVHVIASADTEYAALADKSVDVTTIDDDVAGITVSPTSGLTTTEAGGTASFTVVMNAQPTASVFIGISSSLTSEGTATPAMLIFNTSNWAIPQTVTITGVDDFYADGDRMYSITTATATSGDPNFNGIDPSDVSVTNLGNDVAGTTVTPTTGLVTSEAGSTASFTVALTARPTSNVTLSLMSSDTTEGTVAPASLAFTTSNWSTPQTVTITGVNDAAADGDIAYTIVTGNLASSDSAFNGLSVSDVSVLNIDNEIVSVVVSPTSGLTTTEAGGSATFTVVLSSMPSANVTISLASSDATEGGVSPASLTFTSGTWSVAQTVTVTGQNDLLVDGDIAYTIVTGAAVSADGMYNALGVADVSVTNTDNDAATITVSPTSGLLTNESGSSTTFSVVLTAQPAADVSISLTSSNAAEGTPSVASLTFTNANWSTPQIVTVTGVDDGVADGAVAYSIVTGATSSADAVWNGLAVSDVSLMNVDNEGVGITVAPLTTLYTTEAGQNASFTVVLTSQPIANVVIGLSSSTPAEGTVSVASLTFTSSNWATPQSAYAHGVADGVVDADTAYSIVTAAAVSSDPSYSGFNAADLSVVNVDIDENRCISCSSGYAPVASPPYGTLHLVSTTGRYTITHQTYRASIYDRQNRTTVVAAIKSTGGLTDGYSAYTGMSRNTRFVCWADISGTVVPGDTNSAFDVFLRDTLLNTTVRISQSTAGAEPDADSTLCMVSDDGRYVAFHSQATNLVAGDTNAAPDVFVRDTMMNTTSRVSLSNAGAQLASGGGLADISATGQQVLFSSGSAGTPADVNGQADMFVRDLTMSTTTCVSLTTGGIPAGYAQSASISSDGRYIGFGSAATNNVAGDTNNANDAFVYDTMTGTTTRASTTAGGAQVATVALQGVMVSDDGRYVSFATSSSSLVGDDTNGLHDCYHKDLVTGAITLVTRSRTGAPSNAATYQCWLSGDGHTVVASTNASNLQINDTNGAYDLYAFTIP